MLKIKIEIKISQSGVLEIKIVLKIKIEIKISQSGVYMWSCVNTNTFFESFYNHQFNL